MDMKGEQLIPAPRADVWAALNDPETLKQAIPGCESIEKVSDTELVATVIAKVGPVKATFKGKVTLSDIDPPNSYRISGEGAGGAAGFGKGGATVRLRDAPDGGTLLVYEAQAQVGGKLAQLGSRLIDATARKLADDFFTRFNEIVSARAAPAPAEPVSAEAAKPAAAPPLADGGTNGAGRGIPSWAWGAAVIVVVLIVLWAFSSAG
ncbi:MAG: carbon monoxide dehydrogenase subunit G [Alphaproteobacteria bacterium]|nr:carbon monoxide dehydrogenase subunit G [Alphaproteobacteria bacterium]